MNEPQPLPTDAEIDALLRPFYESDDAAEMAKYDDRLTARAVLAKWGQPQAGAGEPVAEMVPFHTPSGKRVAVISRFQHLPIGTKLYTHPSPPEGMAGWMTLPGPLPEPGKPVLLDIGKKFPIRAMWAAKHTVEASHECPDDWAEYDEAADTYYCPEGWYEWNEHEETHWKVSGTPRGWLAMPPPLASEAGEAS